MLKNKIFLLLSALLSIPLCIAENETSQEKLSKLTKTQTSPETNLSKLNNTNNSKLIITEEEVKKQLAEWANDTNNDKKNIFTLPIAVAVIAGEFFLPEQFNPLKQMQSIIHEASSKQELFNKEFNNEKSKATKSDLTKEQFPKENQKTPTGNYRDDLAIAIGKFKSKHEGTVYGIAGDIVLEGMSSEILKPLYLYALVDFALNGNKTTLFHLLNKDGLGFANSIGEDIKNTPKALKIIGSTTKDYTFWTLSGLKYYCVTLPYNKITKSSDNSDHEDTDVNDSNNSLKLIEASTTTDTKNNSPINLDEVD